MSFDVAGSVMPVFALPMAVPVPITVLLALLALAAAALAVGIVGGLIGFLAGLILRLERELAIGAGALGAIGGVIVGMIAHYGFGKQFYPDVYRLMGFDIPLDLLIALGCGAIVLILLFRIGESFN